MATTIKGLLGTGFSIISTDLNSLANNARALSSSAFSNVAGDAQGGGYEQAYAELVLAAPGAAYTANTGLSVYFLTALDGTNYETGSSSLTPAKMPDIVFPMLATTNAIRMRLHCFVPICATIKVLVVNNGTGQTLAASGNSITLYPLTEQGV